MKVGILGTGDVGQALGKGFLDKGHEVMMGSRDPDNAKMHDWVASAGAKAQGGGFADAAAFGDVVVLATRGAVNDEVIRMANPTNLAGKVLIDATNPLDASEGMPPKLIVPNEGSAGEQVQALAPQAKVVKCFNIVGNPFMVDPDFPGGPPTMFICGNDDSAKKTVKGILDEFGWETSDIGGIGLSHHLESMCIVWVAHGAMSGNWNNAFKMLTK